MLNVGDWNSSHSQFLDIFLCTTQHSHSHWKSLVATFVCVCVSDCFMLICLNIIFTDICLNICLKAERHLEILLIQEISLLQESSLSCYDFAWIVYEYRRQQREITMLPVNAQNNVAVNFLLGSRCQYMERLWGMRLFHSNYVMELSILIQGRSSWTGFADKIPQWILE